MGDTPIKYTIEPSKEPSAYQAATAYVMLFLKGVEDYPLAYIPAETKGTGTATLARGFWFDTERAYEAQVILNKGTGAEIKSANIKVEFAHIYIEKVDPQYPDVKLRWNDYYPALGDKTIVIKGEDLAGNPLTTKKIKAELVYPVKDHPLRPQVVIKSDDPAGVPFKDGKVKVKLSAPTVAPPIEGDPATGIDYVGIRFIVLSDEGKEEGELTGVWNIKNNSNVKLKEVLAGEAVFVYDESSAANHIGKTTAYVTDDTERSFDFVQELLNQVVPRKRSVTTYTLLEEDGVFGGGSEGAIAAFKLHFKVDNVAQTNGDFRKLLKDYSKTAELETWKNRIVDKHILIGKTETTDDYLINDDTDGDTGLYELYKNVVVKFVKNMIHLCESYRDYAQPKNAIQGWVSRKSSSGTTYTVTGSPQAVAYCYGGRRTIREFNERVSKHGAPDYSDVEDNTSYSVYQQYRGNILDAGPNVTNPLQLKHGIVGSGGTKKWPGIRAGIEYNSGIADPTSPDYRAWCYFDYWAGIDCIGLTLNALRYADSPGTYAADQLLSGDQAVPGTNVADVCCTSTAGVSGPIQHDINDFTGVLWNTNVPKFFESTNIDFLYQWPMNQTQHTDQLVHKGDFVHYSGHISMVYSERWGLTRFDSNQYPAIQYDIIHAYGGSSYHGSFSRKVMITGNDIRDTDGNIIQPSGFGRIKLW